MRSSIAIILCIIWTFSLQSQSDTLSSSLNGQNGDSSSISDSSSIPDEQDPLDSSKIEEISQAPSEAGEVAKEHFDNIFEILSPSRILTILFVLFITWLFMKGLIWLIKRSAKRFNRYRLLILRLIPIFNVLIWSVSIISLIVTIFDPSPQQINGALAGSALAVGLASQDLLKNIFGGLMIIFDRPFQMGDRVKVKDTYGEVVHIGLRNTQINTLDDSIVTVPNYVVISEEVSNSNSGELDCMAVVNLWLPINIDTERVRTIAYEAAISSKYLNFDKDIAIYFYDHFDDEPATNVKIKAYVLDTRYEKNFEGDVTEAAKIAFNESGIYSFTSSEQ
ncbi:MAG: mechanosensitive ion channel family protein [Bacteroidota bacterium]